MVDLEQLTSQVQAAVRQLTGVAGLRPGQILIVGCSTSEVLGHKIGTASNREVAEAVYRALEPEVQANRLYLAVQCCEHLNRALVTERACAEKYGLEIVGVVPHLKAGGALSVVAMERLADPVVVESVAAHAGLDIGDTLIGMHLKRVAVPVRPQLKAIGAAHLTMARTRPKLVGGERAHYEPDPGK
ncbi:MAG: TIGR01440 family protein [bacterium]|nr:TIGR01440 family protein [bacterium]